MQRSYFKSNTIILFQGKTIQRSKDFDADECYLHLKKQLLQHPQIHTTEVTPQTSYFVVEAKATLICLFSDLLPETGKLTLVYNILPPNNN